jgi:hypothetical protein
MVGFVDMLAESERSSPLEPAAGQPQVTAGSHRAASPAAPLSTPWHEVPDGLGDSTGSVGVGSLRLSQGHSHNHPKFPKLSYLRMAAELDRFDLV